MGSPSAPEDGRLLKSVVVRWIVAAARVGGRFRRQGRLCWAPEVQQRASTGSGRLLDFRSGGTEERGEEINAEERKRNIAVRWIARGRPFQA
jgi:hypothetical protein